jgi:hypothetical protein
MVAMRPAFRVLLRMLLMFVVLWGAWEVWYRIELRRYEAAVAPILAEADKPLQAASPMKIDDDDAARYYSAAAVAAIGEQPSQPMPAYLIGLVQRLRAAWMNGTAPNPRDTEIAQQALTRSQASVQLADHGAGLSFRRFAPGTSFSYRMSGMIGVQAALALRTLNAVRAGDAEDAGRAIYSRLRLIRALDLEIYPSTEKARQMSELAIDIGLWLGLNPSDVALQQIAEALEEPYRRDELVAVLAKQARFWWGTNAENVRRAGIGAPLLLHLSTPDMRSTVVAMDAVRRPWPQRLQAIKQLSEGGHHVTYGAQTTTINVAIGIAANRAARVAVAAEQGRRREDLAPPLSRGALSGDASVDPFTGGPLLFIRDDNGFVAYSVGANGKDDGGSVDIPANGRAPNIPQGADVGVRVRYQKPR